MVNLLRNYLVNFNRDGWSVYSEKRWSISPFSPRDDEIKGDGNSYAYEYRVHDSRLGRFLSMDPLSKKYPFYSPYQFCGNRLINAIEIEGLEPGVLFDTKDAA